MYFSKRRVELEAVARKLARTEGGHVQLDEIDLRQERLELGLVAEVREGDQVAGAAQLVDRRVRGRVGERARVDFEDYAPRGQIPDEIRRQKLRGDADPRPAFADEVLEPDLAEGVQRDPRRRERRIVTVGRDLLDVAVRVEQLVPLDGLVTVEDRLSGEEDVAHDC
jgi:hypothetical protein